MWNRIKYAFALSVFLAGAVMAADPPAGNKHLFLDFKKSAGYHKFLLSDEMPNEAAQDINNIDFEQNGSLTNRKGKTEYVNFTYDTYPSYVLKELYTFTSTTSVKYILVRVGENAPLRLAPYDRFHFEQTIAEQNLQGETDFLSIDGVGYLINQSTRIIKFSETTPFQPFTLAYVSGSPAGKFAKIHLDNLVVAGSTIPDLANRLFISSANAFESWPPFGYFDIPIGGKSSIITGLGDPIFNSLPVYTDDSIRLLKGTFWGDEETPDNISAVPISNEIGCVHGKTIKTNKNRQYFLSKGPGLGQPGIYMTNGVSVKEMTAGIRNFFREDVKVSTSPLPTAWFDGDKYCVSLASTSGLRLLHTVCVEENGRATIYKNYSIGATVAIGTQTYAEESFHKVGAFRMYGLNSSPDTDQLIENSPANWVPVSWNYKTKDFDLGDKARPKKPDRIYVKHSRSTGTFTVVANFDFGNSTESWTINAATASKNAPIETVSFGAGGGQIVNKLTFKQRPGGNDFNFVNFEVYGSSRIPIGSLDFYYTESVMK